MAICPICGASADDSAKFCTACGTKLTQPPVPAPSEPQPTEWTEQSTTLLQPEASTAPQPASPPQPSYDPQTGYYTPQPGGYTAPQGYTPQPGYASQQGYAPQQGYYGAAQPMYAAAPKKKSKAGWIILGIVGGLLLVGAFAFILSMLIGGKAEQGDPLVGRYVCSGVEMSGISIDPSVISSGELSVELYEGGKCTLTFDGESEKGTWTLEGDQLSINDGDETVTGTMNEDGFVFSDFMGMGVDIFFTRADAAPSSKGSLTTSSSAVPTPSAVTANLDWWTRDWYGWWSMSDCTGTFEQLEGDWWDCIASITANGDGTAQLIIWDEDLPKDNAVAEFSLSFQAENEGDVGMARSGEGYFMDADWTNGDLRIDPSDSPYDNMLSFSGWYDDDDGNGFYYEFYLLPWGDTWDEVVKDEGESALPYYYESGYLPAIAAGEAPPANIEEAWG